MAFSKDFWSQDRTTIHQRTGWFVNLPPVRKFCFVLLVVFVAFWFFYLGMDASAIANQDVEYHIMTATDYVRETALEPAAPMATLEGMDVILLIGADKRGNENSYRTDTIILAFFDWETNGLKMLSIPRDSYAQLQGDKTRKTKINEAYFYGGISMLKSTIEYTLGIEVDNYVELDFNGFEKIIDALGGVTVDVQQRMYKPSEGINLQKGVQTLNGHDALGFVRFRDMLQGDIDRITNQQIFIKALAEQLLKASTIWKAPQLVSIVLENSRTDFTIASAGTLAAALLKTKVDDIQMYSVPGVAKWIGNGSYWIIDADGYAELIKEIAGDKLDEVHEFHIIDDGGRGSYSAPQPTTQEEDEEEPAEDETATDTPAEGEGDSGETADPAAEGTSPDTSADPNATQDPAANPDPNAGTTDPPATPDPNTGGDPNAGGQDPAANPDSNVDIIDIPLESIPEPPASPTDIPATEENA